VTLDAAKIFERILKSLGAKNAPEAARKLGISKQAVYDWQKNPPGLDNLIKIAESTNTSLDWLLIGREEPTRSQVFDPILNRDALTEMIREVVRSEIAQNVQDLGSIDEFDVATAIQKYDNPGTVLTEWYKHDGIAVPALTSMAFSGWAKMSVEQKNKEIVAARGILDRQRKRRAHVSPKDTKRS